jgi:hypothetical protein
MVHIHNDHVYDMLSSLKAGKPKSKAPGINRRTTRATGSAVLAMVESMETYESAQPMEELRINQDMRTNDFQISPTTKDCKTASHAHQVLLAGLSGAIVSSTGLNKASSRGHTIITIQPVLLQDDNIESKLGGKITVIDMAGIERTKRSRVSGILMKESIAINSSISGVLNCLRTIKQNSTTKHQRGGPGDNGLLHESTRHNSYSSPAKRSPVRTDIDKGSNKKAIVPYRDCKLTMLLQPIFSASDQTERPFNSSLQSSETKTIVTLLISAYPGNRDYAEKKSLFGEIAGLRGLSVVNVKSHKASGTRTLTSPGASMPPKHSTPCDFPGIFSSPDPPASSLSSGKKKSSPWTKKSPLKRISAVIGKSPKKKRREEEASNHEMMMARMAQLEKENKNLADRNQKLERTYHDFQAKSETMERLLEESMMRDAVRAKEELEWIKARERRIKEQTLVASPLSKHMAALDRTGNMSTIGQVSSMKQPFQLALPSERRKKEDEILISLNRAISPLRESDDDNTQLMNENADPQKPKMKKEGSNTSMKRKSTTGEMTSPTSKKSRMDQHELFFLGKFAGK